MAPQDERLREAEAELARMVTERRLLLLPAMEAALKALEWPVAPPTLRKDGTVHHLRGGDCVAAAVKIREALGLPQQAI